ncbi:MAG: hypothetical protein M1832_000797 [Thelocarpon impressellum]|nr:MAG: hypothetical protein M1832_000797 [Thelocarpon impressellum]
MPSPEDATERSPLLEQTEDIIAESPDESNGAPGGGKSAGRDSEEGGNTNGHAEELRNFDGMPEMRKKMVYILPAVAIGIFLSAVDQTITVSSYGKIGSELHSLNTTAWIATSYLLTLTSFQPLYGKLSDIFGRKSALLFAYSVFGIGALFCGLARSMNELIAARAFAGIGGGGMTTVVSILLSDIVPLRNRGTWQGYLNIIYATGAGLGAPLGGVFADFIGWRWAFLGQVPLCLVAIVSVYFVLQLPVREKVDWKVKLKRVDFLGAVVMVAAVFNLLLGLDRGSNESWRAPITIGCLCASLTLFILFIYVEMRLVAEPLAPGHIIFERSLFACYLCNFFSFGGWLSALFYVPLFYQAVDGLSATQAGVRLLPGIVAGVSGSLFGGVVMQKTGRYYWLTVTAYTCLTVGIIPILMFTGLVSKSTWGISVGLVICGFSNGIGVTTSLIALLSNASSEDVAVATACSYLFRSLGSVVTLSLSATVVQQSLRSHLGEALKDGAEAEEIVRKVRESLDYINTLEPWVRDLVKECYGSAVRAGFAMDLAIVAGAMISAFWIREKNLSR